jgi:hypothetical protein
MQLEKTEKDPNSAKQKELNKVGFDYHFKQQIVILCVCVLEIKKKMRKQRREKIKSNDFWLYSFEFRNNN